jgi:diguanylate cyclase (GGDEF)-like protein/PAS domain S-box-containing protein
MSRRRLAYPLATAAALTLAGGLAATVGLALAVGQLEYDKLTLGFAQRASERSAAIQQGLDEAVEVLTVTNQLFTAASPVSRQQFHDFTAPLLARYPFIHAFNYHRLVSGAERSAVEAELAAVVPGTQFTEMTGGPRGPAPQRDQYSIVDYLEPMAGNEAAFGLNVATNRIVMTALDQAVQQRRAASTGLLSLAQDARKNSGFEVIMPVYRPGAPLDTLAQRRAALVGDTAAIIKAGVLVRMILEDSKINADPGVLVWVYASAAADPARLVYASAGGPAVPAPPVRSRLVQWLAPGAGEAARSTLEVAGQPWHVLVSPVPRPFVSDHLGSLSTLIGGSLFAFLMTAFVQTLVMRSRRVQRLVNERTADLKLSNQALSDDVLARRRTEAALQDSEQRFRQLVTMSSDWYWEQDEHLRFTHIDGGMAAKSGVAPERLLGLTRWETVEGMEHSSWGQAHIACLMAREPFANLEYASRDDNGALRWFCVNGEPVFDQHQQFKGYRGTGTDITARKLTEQRIQHVAQHDVLTGLPNRSLLQDRLSQAVAYSVRSGHPVWVMLIDLDRFKFVNDSMGHKAGDVLLMTIAARLRSALRDTDTVARLSGDEFVLILTEHDQEQLTAEIVQRLMDAVARPVMLGSKEFFVTCSIGVAVHPTDGASASGLIEHADIAMYRAKKLGRNNFQFYTPAMNEEAMERVRIESALRNALERGEFVLHYQPQVNLVSGQVVGMEALIRWQHPELGVVAPHRFITVAEETGLIVPIGAWVMRTACAQNKAWQDAGLGQLRVAVNLSARQFGAPNLLADIGAVLEATGLAPALLEIELTESLFMSDVNLAVETLHGMKKLGVNLSIDDFGTGYSSLSYLSRFPIDVLKIDRSFVSDITRDASDAAIVASIIALAHNLKLDVIAEGVETAEQLDYLRRHRCDEMQGYYFSKPLAAAEFEQLLRQKRCLPAQPAKLPSMVA